MGAHFWRTDYTSRSIRDQRYQVLTRMIMDELSVWGVDLWARALAGLVSGDENERAVESGGVGGRCIRQARIIVFNANCRAQLSSRSIGRFITRSSFSGHLK